MPRRRTSYVMKRLSTLRYEIARDMTPQSRPLSELERVFRNGILCNDGFCEYCRRNKVSKGFGDHFYPVISGKYPSAYCDDDWNRVPACTTCNVSKGGKTWKEWFDSDTPHNPLKYMTAEEQLVLMEKFSRYDKIMQKELPTEASRQKKVRSSHGQGTGVFGRRRRDRRFF